MGRNGPEEERSRDQPLLFEEEERLDVPPRRGSRHGREIGIDKFGHQEFMRASKALRSPRLTPGFAHGKGWELEFTGRPFGPASEGLNQQLVRDLRDLTILAQGKLAQGAQATLFQNERDRKFVTFWL